MNLEQLLDPVNLRRPDLRRCPVGGGARLRRRLQPRLAMLILKNLGRSPVRTVLISLAVVVLVAMVTLIWTVVFFLDQTMTERSKDLKLIITERWQLPSQMPVKHADYLDPKSPSMLPALKGLYGPNDFMTWSFYGGYTDPDEEGVRPTSSSSSSWIPTDQDDDGRSGELRRRHARQAEGEPHRLPDGARSACKNLNKKVGEKLQDHEPQLSRHRPRIRDRRRIAGRPVQPRRHHADGLLSRGVRQVRARQRQAASVDGAGRIAG